MTRYVAYWLVPSREPLTFFQGLIETLAHSQGAPVFTPHVTIHAGESPAGEDPRPVIAHSMRGLTEVRLRTGSVAHSGLFTKTLFVQFHPSQVLSRVAADLRRLSICPSDYILDPHLSLLYKNMPAQDRETLAASLRLPLPEVSFDAVWAVAFGGTPHTAEDVKSWEVTCRFDLRDLGTEPAS
jgi:hypothetical protein